MIFHRKGIYAYFWCPGCDDLHQVDDKWTISGTDEAPTIRASVLVTLVFSDYAHSRGIADIRCHSFVTDGQIAFLADCTHAMAGQTVPLAELPEWAEMK